MERPTGFEIADTPRTDEAAIPIDRVDTVASRPAYIVNAEFARTLERELAESQNKLFLSREAHDIAEQELAQAQKRLQWLEQHATYLEHTDKNGVRAMQQERGGYWPQTSEDKYVCVDQEMVGLDFIEYIDEQLRLCND